MSRLYINVAVSEFLIKMDKEMLKRMPEWIQVLKEHYDKEYSKNIEEVEGGKEDE